MSKEFFPIELEVNCRQDVKPTGAFCVTDEAVTPSQEVEQVWELKCELGL